jgi:glucokinase
MSDERILVGDVGGTHARFAIARKAGTQWNIDHRSDIETEAANFEDVLHGYLDKLDSAERPTAAAIAVAGPVTAGKVSFTNRNWQLSEAEFTRQGFQRALLINDFAALAFAAAQAQPHELSRSWVRAPASACRVSRAIAAAACPSPRKPGTWALRRGPKKKSRCCAA